MFTYDVKQDTCLRIMWYKKRVTYDVIQDTCDVSNKAHVNATCRYTQHVVCKMSVNATSHVYVRWIMKFIRNMNHEIFTSQRPSIFSMHNHSRTDFSEFVLVSTWCTTKRKHPSAKSCTLYYYMCVIICIIMLTESLHVCSLDD